MTDAKLTAPAAGDEIALKLTVLDGTVQMAGKHYGDTIRLVVRVDSGPDGIHFGNLFLTADAKSRWFPRQAGEVLDAIEAGDDPAALKQRKAEAKTKKSKKTANTDDRPADNVRSLDPADDDDLAGFTVRQLKALLDRRGVTYARSMKKPELLSLARDAIAETEAAA